MAKTIALLKTTKNILLMDNIWPKKLIHRRAGTLRIVVLLDEQASPS